ncbi:substrate-binding domain-containing protein [Aestuariibaculum sp. YM273]|uniref:hybrid sensor histidine kinase/response regulator transcription factor n=1 Tax=Aestuariibaculum sp. YM273 TaxID=3070659 RepID=UPI0027DC5DC1|nr:substrate-binding domain-containing protein [Aestuariibaculum sp. YM273]WMI64805.1 substrate-binding domain-containing protein [Aestuariibaculum sp. YM273]
MKLRFNVLLRLILIFNLLFLAACKPNNEQHIYKIGFSQTGFADDWRKAMNQSMQIQAAFNPNTDLKILNGEDNVEKQIKDIEQLIKEKVDVLIVSPVKSKPITPIVEKAYKAGISVLIVDRKIEGNNYTAYIGADNYQVGADAANYLASVANTKSNILEIKGLSGSSPALERSLGFNNVINKSENLNVVTSLNSNWESYSIKDSLRYFLKINNDINYIFAHNDRLALGAWEVVKEVGLQQDLKIIGVDGLPGPNGGIQLVQENILMATMLYPTGGDETMKLVSMILNNQKVPKNNVLKTIVIDSRNAEIMKNQYDKIAQHQLDIENQQKRISKQERIYSTQKNVLRIVLILLFTSILLGAYSIYSGYKIKKSKRELEIQNNKITVQRNQIKKIAEEVKISNEAKVNFFTGLSHEFKTPLTLILSSIESLSESKTIKDSKMLSEVGLIFNNSKRLLRLINQLLDFRKIEDRKFILKASETNLFEFSKMVFKDFEKEAQKRDIKFSLACNNEALKVFLDRNLMDKVYFNLLSNAFKFTPNNGTVKINIEDDAESNFVKIHFKDSGIGIPENELKNVFKPFYQGSNNNQPSSGIGLHISKEFIELHKGTIEVFSKHGTEFIISLYKGKAHLNPEEIIFEPDVIDDSIIKFENDYEDDTFNQQNTESPDEHYSILIVEDNPDLLKYLKGKLNSEYKVYTSEGSDAIEKALEIVPDILICDVNLPDKNGFEICKLLKQDLRTSHIPTIILTALNDKDSYIKGLQSGADLFLTKPFSFGILFQSIKTLLFNREKLRYYYVNNMHKIESDQNFGLFEQNFITSINKLIENNLDNSKFSVEQLAEGLNISRVQLYRKLKAILGVNISDYILNIRLERAKVLLETSPLTVSEIAYATGFSTPNYFSTTFKNKYNVSPKTHRTEFLK